MKLFLSILKWLAILVAALFAYAYYDSMSEVNKKFTTLYVVGFIGVWYALKVTQDIEKRTNSHIDSIMYRLNKIEDRLRDL